MLAMPRLLLPSVPPSAGQPIVAGWAYQWIAQLSLDRDSWTAPVDAARLHPLETPTSRPPRRSMGCWASAGRRGGAAVRIRWRLRLRPAQLRPHPGADGRTGAATRQPLLLFRPAGSPAWPRGPTAAPRRQVQLGRPDYLANPHRHARNHPRPVRHRDRAGLGRAASKQQRHPGHGSRGPRPVVGGTILRVQVERVPAKTRPPKVLWLWWAGPEGCELDLDLAWRAYIRRFDLEHTIRFCKQTLGWTTPRPRHPAQADRWTWLVLAGYTQLRLARQVATDARLPWERARPQPRLSPYRVRRGFPQLLCALGSPAAAPKPSGDSSGRPKGRASGPAVRHPALKKPAKKPRNRSPRTARAT